MKTVEQILKSIKPEVDFGFVRINNSDRGS